MQEAIRLNSWTRKGAELDEIIGQLIPVRARKWTRLMIAVSAVGIAFGVYLGLTNDPFGWALAIVAFLQLSIAAHEYWLPRVVREIHICYELRPQGLLQTFIYNGGPFRLRQGFPWHRMSGTFDSPEALTLYLADGGSIPIPQFCFADEGQKELLIESAKARRLVVTDLAS